MENIDTAWNEKLAKLQGDNGIHILVNDNKDIISKLIKALANVDCLPEDLSNPQTVDEAWAVDSYASTLHDLFCKGAEITEAMMVGEKVERAYEDIQDEKGETRDMHHETGHKRSDF